MKNHPLVDPHVFIGSPVLVVTRTKSPCLVLHRKRSQFCQELFRIANFLAPQIPDTRVVNEHDSHLRVTTLQVERHHELVLERPVASSQEGPGLPREPRFVNHSDTVAKRLLNTALLLNKLLPTRLDLPGGNTPGYSDLPDFLLPL